MGLSITILQPANLTATVDGGSILAAVVGASATLTVEMGVPGPGATIQVGTTTTGDAGTDAEVVNVGTLSAAILDFTIPRGDQGVQGIQGPQGIQGVKGDQGIQGVKGDKGNTGDQGPQGEQGVPGEKGDKGDTGAGVAVGGSAGQVLAKIDSTDYNTEWIDVSSGGGTWGSITGTLSSQTDLQNALNGNLSLSGGGMTGNIGFNLEGNGVFFQEGTFITTELLSNKLAMYSNDTSGNNSEVGPWGIGVTNTISGQTAQLESQQIRIYNGDYVNGTSLTPNGINFNDETTQTTAGLPLTGGTMTGVLTIDGVDGASLSLVNSASFSVNNYAGITTNIAEGIEIIQQNLPAPEVQLSRVFPTYFQIFDVNSSEETQTFTVNLSGIEKTGSAAFSLLADFGLTMNNGISFTPTTGLTLKADSSSKITFPDLSEQTTAFPPAGGTTAQYIDGTGALQTFPTVTSVGKILTSVRNNSGATMTKGTVVYINGAVGNKPTVTKAQANSEAGSKATYGFIETGIANNADGNVVVIGLLENLDTQGFADGTQIYLSPTVAGGFTSTQPFSPYHYVRLGTVIRGNHPTQGSIEVNIQNGFQLDEMSDVGATSPTNNNVLTWVSASSQWLDRSISTILGYTPANVANYAYATNLQAVQNTSSTTVLSPANSRFAGISTNIWSPGVTGLSALGTGTGNNTGSTVTSLNGRLLAPNATTAGYATRGFNLFYPSYSVNNGYNYGTASGHSVKVYTTSWASTVTGVKMRAVFGRMSTSLPVPATLSSRGYGWEWDFSTKAISIIAHNGTSLTSTAQTWTPVANRTYDIAVYSSGSGTISLYIDGTLIGSITGGPTDTSTTNQIWWQIEIENQATAGSQLDLYYANPKVITSNG